MFLHCSPNHTFAEKETSEKPHDLIPLGDDDFSEF